MDLKFVFIGFGITMVLIFLIFLINWVIVEGMIKKENTENILLKNKTIDFDSMTLKQKIAQMIIVRGDFEDNLEMVNFNLGGIFLDNQTSEEGYKELIERYQHNSKIKLFVSTDLEGAWIPKGFRIFPYFSEINSSKEAKDVGLNHGELLKKLGFNIDFSPVSEFSDESYGGRVFLGSKGEIKEKLENYINGLQKNVFGVCKHYPGKGLIHNLHWRGDKEEITKDDLELFSYCVKSNISGVMIGHQAVTGKIDSMGKPSSVSKDVISYLREKQDFTGLIISDEINMMGLRLNYFSKKEMYRDLINPGENVILDFRLNSRKLYSLLNSLEKDVKSGKISEEKINESVKLILTKKGYKIR